MAHESKALKEGTFQPLTRLLEASLASGFDARFEVDGRSMLPLVRPGDKVELTPLTSLQVRLGDVVCVRGGLGDGAMIHRVVAQKADRLVIRGDNTTIANGLFPREAVLGIITAVERKGRPVWFGSGRFGPLVAFAVRHGLIRRANRVVYGARRRVEACLKFFGLTSRLREHKGDDGNE